MAAVCVKCGERAVEMTLGGPYGPAYLECEECGEAWTYDFNTNTAEYDHPDEAKMMRDWEDNFDPTDAQLEQANRLGESAAYHAEAVRQHIKDAGR